MKSSNSSVFELLESPLCFDKAQFENLWLMKPTREQHCILFGQAVVVPRNYEVYGEQYRFAGQENIAIPVPDILAPFLAYGNSVLLNWYEDGSKYIGYHSDNENGLIGPVYAFSYGVARNFKFKNKKSGEIDTVVLKNNSLLVMKENTQRTHKHSLPVMKKVTQRRISVTVRTIKNVSLNKKNKRTRET